MVLIILIFLFSVSYSSLNLERPRSAAYKKMIISPKIILYFLIIIIPVYLDEFNFAAVVIGA